MMGIYFIKGTISICVGGSKQIRFTPCAAFLTPDKQKAIAFPKGKANNAKLIELSGDKKSFECNTKAIKGYIRALLANAGQQRPIELRLDKSNKIVGFVFPAP